MGDLHFLSKRILQILTGPRPLQFLARADCLVEVPCAGHYLSAFFTRRLCEMQGKLQR